MNFLKKFIGPIKNSLKFFALSTVLAFLLFILFNSSVPNLLKTTVTPEKALATYQFNPDSSNLVVGTETPISSATAASAEGTNVGSWKGTLADDNFHWMLGGDASNGLDAQLNVGGVQLNGANKLIIQTEIDLDANIGLLVQVCDWTSATGVDNAADAQCTGGGWRTLNTKNSSQVAVGLNTNAGVAFQWHIYNGYFSTGTSGGASINTPLTNFINGSNQIKVRYYTSTGTATYIAIDYLRVYAIIDPSYFPGDFVQNTGGTPSGQYNNTFMMGNSATAQQTTTGDATYLQVPGTVGAPADFYLKFKNVKTYQGMNTILVNTDAACSAATAGLQYRFKLRNFHGTTSTADDTWEDISSTLDCSTTDYFNNYAKNNINIADYINSSGEIWIGMYALSNSVTSLKLDSIYLLLGTTNTDSNDCEISFGSNIAGRVATNPSAPGADRIQAMSIDANYMYVAGYDSSGIDNEWRIEKRNLSDGDLVPAFGTNGVVVNDPSTGADQIFAIATTSDAIFAAGYDTATGGGQWRIEKRDITTGNLMTAFNSTGIIQYNPNTVLDEIMAIAVDANYLYVTGFENSTVGVWRINKYDINTGALVTAFGGTGMISETLAATGDERPQAIKVDTDYLYIAGYDNVAGNNQWRLEKRNKTTGALCDGAINCAAGAFNGTGIMQENPSSGIDMIYAMTIDASSIYLGGYDLSAGAGEWRIEKRNIVTGALDTNFNTTGIIQFDPSTRLEWITDITADNNYLYIAGYANPATTNTGAWWIQKRDKITGALDNNFSSDGTGQSEDGADDRPNAIAVSGAYLYISGYGTAPGDNQWLIEKRNISNGLRTNDNFGDNNCTGTRDIDITGGNRNAWTIQTEDESTNFGRPFYALDNDGDAAVEEAGSANIGFSVTVPSNAAVSGIYWAGRMMSGAAGTVRLAVKDYSGLTGITGGRMLVGSSGSSAMIYTDSIATGGVAAAGGATGMMNNPEDFIDTVNNQMRLNLNTTADGATNVNSVNIWDFAMVSFSWTEDSSHPTKTYQFNPESSNLVVGMETPISSASAASAEGTNVGSWKGTLADDNFHWMLGGDASNGLDAQLNVGGVQLNGANKLIVQTEIDLDANIGLLVQICDWSSSTGVDNLPDAQCTGGGWRTLNTKNSSQVAVGLNTNAGVAFQWHIYNGYFSDNIVGGSAINTPLANFINGSNQIKVRYYTSTGTATYIAIDYLRIYAVIDPSYFPGDFVQVSGGTPLGYYPNTIMMGNTATTQQTTTGDAQYLQVPGTVSEPADFYMKFKNVKTYQGMNTILINTEAFCSAATADLQYRFKLRNFHGTASTGDDTWEDVSSTLDCSATSYFNNYAKNNINISDYINSSGEIWVGMYALSNSTTKLELDSMYIMLGTTNTDSNDCEISFGSNIAGRIATNPSAPGADRIEVMKIDANYMYVAGYDSFGIDNEWRIEKRNLSDGNLVSTFGDNGIIVEDPSSGADQIEAITFGDGALFVAGSDLATGAGQWRIEKRDMTTGALVTTFNGTGIIQYNPGAALDQAVSMTADASYIYVTGFENSTTGTWRINKYDIITGALVTDFGGTGMISETLAATGDERPQRIKVDNDYVYISGYDNMAGNMQWRVEKRNKTTGALCDGVSACAAGAFNGTGILQENPSANIDRIYAMSIDDSYIYLGGQDGVLSAANVQWRIEKRDIVTGALITDFDGDGIIQVDPTSADVDSVTDLTTDGSYLYIAGFKDDDTGSWYIQKRDKTTGAVDTNFSGDGTGQSEDGSDDRANAIAVDANYVYIAGYGSAPGDNQWLIEKRNITNGLRTSDNFGANDCTGTRDIDITGGNRNAWTIQTEDESTNFGRPFYALDNDGDAAVEEAGSANIGFSVTVPNNAVVTSVYWAGRMMSGVAGTVRLAMKDYSGLTGTTGGRVLVGASGTTVMAYTDSIASGGVALVGGAAGMMNNPESFIDSVNNKMRLNLNTTADGGTDINSVNIWDFAMVSFSWIETTSPVVSITLDTSNFSYGMVNPGTSSSTLPLWGGTGIIATNGAARADFDIYGANTTGSGSGWTLAANNTGNNYVHKFCNQTDSSCLTPPTNYTALTTSLTRLKSGVSAGGNLSFQLQITPPLVATDLSQQNAVVTVQASAP